MKTFEQRVIEELDDKYYLEWYDTYYPEAGERLSFDLIKSFLLEKIREARVSRERFRYIMCEYTPTIAEDSGLPEWSQGELDKAYDDVILSKGVWSNIIKSEEAK